MKMRCSLTIGTRLKHLDRDHAADIKRERKIYEALKQKPLLRVASIRKRRGGGLFEFVDIEFEILKEV